MDIPSKDITFIYIRDLDTMKKLEKITITVYQHSMSNSNLHVALSSVFGIPKTFKYVNPISREIVDIDASKLFTLLDKYYVVV